MEYSPDSEEFSHLPQFTRWEDAVCYSDVYTACELNEDPAWYPEYWVTYSRENLKVFVRPHDAWVSYSDCTGNGWHDHGRAVMATMLSRALGGKKIEVLE